MQSTSWGDSIRAIQDSKVERQAIPTEMYLSRRRGEIFDKHTPHPFREGHGKFHGFHPITGRYKEESKEEEYARIHNERLIVRSNIARDKQLKHVQDFDILNQWPKVEQPPPPPPRELSRTFSGGAPHHILSNEPIPIEMQSDSARSYRPQRPFADYRPSLVRRRAVDIISNDYVFNNNNRKERDEALAKQQITKRYWQTHNFNPLTQTYYDPDKEAAAQHLIDISKTVQGMAQQSRLPPTHRVSTGFAYDIVLHRPRDEATLNTVDLMETRPLRRLNRLAREDRLHADGEFKSDVETRRVSNQVRMRKHEELFDPRGYDVITGESRDQRVMEKGTGGLHHEVKAWDIIDRELSLPPPPRTAPTATGFLPVL